MNLYKKNKGDTYEFYVLQKLKKNFDDIWLFKFTPEKILQQTKLFDNYDIYTKYKNCDIGADLVAIKDDKIFFIQCKNHNNTLCINDLQGFYFLLHEYDLNGFVVYSNEISSRIKDLSNKVQYIHIPYNNQIIDVNYNFLNIINIKSREYQIEAYDLLKNENRSILSLPSGMGKTYTSFLIAKEYDNIIYISPLRFLAKQILDQVYNYSNKLYNPILISSDGIRNINCIEQILMNKNLLSITYDSVDILIKIIDKLDNKIIIIDEFHNLSDNNLNNKNDNMNKILENKNNKILFLSATPIENKKYYGDLIYKYSWSEAIKNKYICDFKIILPIKNEELNKFNNVIVEIKNKKLVKKCYFLLKSLLYEGNNNCIVFLTTIEQANEFNKILLWMQNMLNMELEINIISYNTSRLKRIEIINNFKLSNKISILLNIHILDEGIDIPECDSVFIVQPNDNIINLVQRMCRCNRITEYKTKCNMILWCGEKKINKILDYLQKKTNNEITNKIFKFDINNKKIINVNYKKNIDELIYNNKFIYKNNEYNELIYENNKSILLKKHTNIDQKFINTFFKKFKIGGELDFDIKDKDVAEYLGITLDNVRRRLQNKYSKTKKFIEKVDFIKQKLEKTSSVIYLLNYQCFEKLAMNSETSQAEIVRLYFVKLREFIVENQHLIYQAIENKQDLSIYRGYESIYFFAVDNRKQNIFKVGRTQDIIQRLRNYNVGRIKEVELKYFALVKNPLLIEKCIKLKLEKNLYFEDREIYTVELNKLKKIIDECYCKFVSRQQNEELYKEISDLLGLYAYTKNKINIKPYVIIR
jgi:superfamily II DNA or RNA helicase